MGLNNDEIFERFEQIEQVRIQETTQLEQFTKTLTDQYKLMFEELKKSDTKQEYLNTQLSQHTTVANSLKETITTMAEEIVNLKH